RSRDGPESEEGFPGRPENIFHGHRILCACRIVIALLEHPAPEAAMKRQIVIYKTKPEHNAENERLLKAVFAELHAKQPKDVRYVLARLGEDTYVHLVFTDTPE